MTHTWDLFISHASEDKNAVVRPLSQILKGKGLRVWVDEAELTLGDSLRRAIDKGLVESRFGVVILSKAFFAKEWPQRELDALVVREVNGGKAILPVWHGISSAEVARYSPILASKLSVNTDLGLDAVVESILRAIGGTRGDTTAAEGIDAGMRLTIPFQMMVARPSSMVGTKCGQYQLEKFLGMGGSGTAFEAVHLPTLKRVCLKLCYPLDKKAGAVFQSVTRAVHGLSALAHPSIAKYLDFGEFSYADGASFFITTELVDGVRLDHWSADLTEPGAFRVRLTMAIAIAEALAAAHEARFIGPLGFEEVSVLHGDLTPSNILVQRDGTPRLIDFMLVDVQRLLDPRVVPPQMLEDAWRPRGRRIATTAAFGTPGFMSPEQEQQGIVSVETDIFTLGMTLCHLFAPGHIPPPFAIQRMRRPDGPLPPEVVDLCLRLLRWGPGRRERSARECAVVLRNIGDAEVASSR